jgi:hypothetical protein
VCDLFLGFLCQAKGFRALDAVTGAPVELGIGKSKGPIRLERAKLLDHAAWSRLRELGPELLGIGKPPSHRSVGAQDVVAADLETAAVARRQTLTALHQLLVEQDAGDSARTTEVKSTLSRLAPLVGPADSYDRLSNWLAAWPDDAEDPLRVTLRGAPSALGALQELDSHARGLLQSFASHPELGAAVQSQLERLHRSLTSEERVEALTVTAMSGWNAQAQTLLREAVEKSARVQPAPLPTPAVPPRRAPRTKVVMETGIDLQDADAVNGWLTELRRELLDSGQSVVKLTVTLGDIER